MRLRVACGTVVALIFACSSGSFWAQPEGTPLVELPPDSARPHPVPKELGAWVDSYVGAIGKGLGEAYEPSGIVLVAQDGRPIVIRSFGRANRSTGAVPDVDTQFRIASNTKQFTAVTIAQLAEQSRLKYSDPISKFLPHVPHAWASITIHQLLTQTSGLPSYTAQKEILAHEDKPHTHDQVIASISALPLNFRPGERFEYSNTNYYLLGMIIEKISGESYESYLQKHILARAGMTRSSTIESASQHDVALGYTMNDDDEPIRAQRVDSSVPFAAGALHSTARDLLAWDHALAGKALISEVSKTRLFTPEKDGYACGWVRSEVEHETVLSHGGRMRGCDADVARVPPRGLLVVALSNNQFFDAQGLVKVVLRMALGGVAVPPPNGATIVKTDPTLVRSYEGEYLLTRESEYQLSSKLPKSNIEELQLISLSDKGGYMNVQANGQSGYRVYQAADGSFVSPRRQITLRFAHDGFVITQYDLVMDYTRQH